MYFKRTYCPGVLYFVKADDDIVLDLDRLIHFSSVISNPNHIYGAIRFHDFPVRRRWDRL